VRRSDRSPTAPPSKVSVSRSEGRVSTRSTRRLPPQPRPAWAPRRPARPASGCPRPGQRLPHKYRRTPQRPIASPPVRSATTCWAPRLGRSRMAERWPSAANTAAAACRAGTNCSPSDRRCAAPLGRQVPGPVQNYPQRPRPLEVQTAPSSGTYWALTSCRSRSSLPIRRIAAVRFGAFNGMGTSPWSCSRNHRPAHRNRTTSRHHRHPRYSGETGGDTPRRPRATRTPDASPTLI